MTKSILTLGILCSLALPAAAARPAKEAERYPNDGFRTAKLARENRALRSNVTRALKGTPFRISYSSPGYVILALGHYSSATKTEAAKAYQALAATGAKVGKIALHRSVTVNQSDVPSSLTAKVTGVGRLRKPVEVAVGWVQSYDSYTNPLHRNWGK